MAFPPSVFAQQAAEDHIVPSQALVQAVVNSSATRQQNIATVMEFLSTPTAERALKDAHMSPVQVRTAVPTLSDQELQNLATRASTAQQKFSAGMMSSELLIIVILLVAVIIIVAAIH
jgi:hypothetical protein